MRKIILAVFVLMQLSSCSRADSVYENETIDFIKEIVLSDYDLVGNVKSVTTFKDLSLKNQNSRRYFYPKFRAAFNEKGKLVEYVFYVSGMSRDTAYIREIKYANNLIDEKGTYENYRTTYNNAGQPLDTEKIISVDKYNRRYNYYHQKRTYTYDVNNRLQSNTLMVKKTPSDTLLIKEIKNYSYTDDYKTEYNLQYNQRQKVMDTFSTRTYKINDNGRILSYDNTTLKYADNKLIQKRVKSFEDKIESYQYQGDLLLEYTLVEDGIEYQKTEYQYNDKGNLISRKDFANGNLNLSSTYTYVYDDRGNWTKKIVDSEITRGGLVINRDITYWE